MRLVVRVPPRDSQSECSSVGRVPGLGPGSRKFETCHSDLIRIRETTTLVPMATREAQREYQRNWMRKRRQAWLDENGPCVDCCSSDNLEVDHRDYREKVTHNVWSWSQVRRETELAKCVVRCAPCHLAKTAAENRIRCRGVANNGRARLNAEKVAEIRTRVASGETLRSLASEYGVAFQTIWDVVQHRSWKYIP